MLPSDIKDREHKKFVENASGDVTVRVTAEDLELGAVEITDGRDGGTDRAAVDWDGTYNALAVMDSRMKTDVDDNAIAKDQVLPVNIPLNYGYDTSGAFWSRFLVETDNDAIPAGQITQLVIPLNYYYEAKTSTWKRWQGESGSMWTTVVGLYTPTFDPITDDTADALKVIGQETPTDDYVTPTKSIQVLSCGMVYDGTTWDMQRGDSTNGTLVNLGSNNDVIVTETTPTDTSKNNSSLVLAYTDGDLTTITKTIDGTSYEKTLTWTSGVLTSVSVWTEI